MHSETIKKSYNNPFSTLLVSTSCSGNISQALGAILLYTINIHHIM